MPTFHAPTTIHLDPTVHISTSSPSMKSTIFINHPISSSLSLWGLHLTSPTIHPQWRYTRVQRFRSCRRFLYRSMTLVTLFPLRRSVIWIRHPLDVTIMIVINAIRISISLGTNHVSSTIRKVTPVTTGTCWLQHWHVYINITWLWCY